MIKERELLVNNLFGFLDVLISLGTFILALRIGEQIFSNTHKTIEYLSLGILIIPVWYILLKTFNLAILNRTINYGTILANYLKVILSGTLILLVFIYLFRIENINRITIIVLFPILNLIALIILRIFLFRILKNYRHAGYNTIYVLLIADDMNEKFIQKIMQPNDWGLRVIGIVTDSPHIREEYCNRTAIYPESYNLPKLLENKIIDEVIYCKNQIDQKHLQSLIYSCEEVGAVFRMQSILFNMTTTKANLHHFQEIPFLTFRNTPSDVVALSLKWLVDFSLSLLFLIIWAPIFVLIGLLIKFTSKGPIIFKQKRVGKRGREFYMYKFRTMVKDAETMRANLEDQNEVDGPVFKIKEDPRITPIGGFLRKTGLDELPQLFNVLIGDMSLVGPRPPIMKEVKKYKRWQLRRLSMKPGITCIWQIMPDRNNISFEEWMRLDLQYIDTWSPKLDYLLLFKTIKTIFKRYGY